MEPFGFAHFINTTWNTVIKFQDKVNWNVSPDVLQHFPTAAAGLRELSSLSPSPCMSTLAQ